MVLSMQPLSTVVCRLVQMHSTLLQCVTDPVGLIAAWKDSPLNLQHKYLEFRVKPVEFVINAGEVELLRASLDPDVDKCFRIVVTMKLLKSSGFLGFRVKLGSKTSMRLDQGGREDPSEVTSRLATTGGTPTVRKNPLRKFALVIWNCKGYDHAQFHVGLREIVSKFIPSVLLVTNSRGPCKDGKEKVDTKPFESYHVVEPVLGCGGAILMWNTDEVFLCYEKWNSVAFTAEVSTTPNPCMELV
ncbi:hypothetical protein CCACVL1_30134 [Corchorus capsularis]|uniref:Endonuclease/exonuclease/phosphatase n=1 Tax=Corchorus capsularis TaxID=210143 RepID=A0A1R3FYQ4_COCAP|nr:hypothetical protein CCACVL1_30134 [Corchorus capsularis]